MNISDLKEGPFEGEVEGTIKDKQEIKEVFSKFGGRKSKVCNATLEDDSGAMKLTLWNDETETYNDGDTIKITNGYVSSFKGELQVSKGRNGTIEKV